MALRLAAAALACWAAADPIMLARASGPIELGASPVRVELQPVDSERSLGAALERVAQFGELRIQLVVSDLSAEQHPGTMFDVYVNLPPGADPAATGAPCVGRITFFNEVRHGRPQAPKTFRTFDVTALVSDLRARGQLPAALPVTIVAQRPVAPDAQATIGEVSLVAR